MKKIVKNNLNKLEKNELVVIVERMKHKNEQA